MIADVDVEVQAVAWSTTHRFLLNTIQQEALSQNNLLHMHIFILLSLLLTSCINPMSSTQRTVSDQSKEIGWTVMGQPSIDVDTQRTQLGDLPLSIELPQNWSVVNTRASLQINHSTQRKFTLIKDPISNDLVQDGGLVVNTDSFEVICRGDRCDITHKSWGAAYSLYMSEDLNSEERKEVIGLISTLTAITND